MFQRLACCTERKGVSRRFCLTIIEKVEIDDSAYLCDPLRMAKARYPKIGSCGVLKLVYDYVDRQARWYGVAVWRAPAHCHGAGVGSSALGRIHGLTHRGQGLTVI